MLQARLASIPSNEEDRIQLLFMSNGIEKISISAVLSRNDSRNQKETECTRNEKTNDDVGSLNPWYLVS